MLQKFDIYYRKDGKGFFGMHSSPLTLADIKDPEKFCYLQTVLAHAREDVFMMMQGEVWSPNGEARSLIQKLGLDHTSMSVGDVLRIVDDDVWYVCDMIGWKKVTE